MIGQPVHDIVLNSPVVDPLPRLEQLVPGVPDVMCHGRVIHHLDKSFDEVFGLGPHILPRFTAELYMILSFHPINIASRFFQLDFFTGPQRVLQAPIGKSRSPLTFRKLLRCIVEQFLGKCGQMLDFYGERCSFFLIAREHLPVAGYPAPRKLMIQMEGARSRDLC